MAKLSFVFAFTFTASCVHDAGGLTPAGVNSAVLCILAMPYPRNKQAQLCEL